MLTVSALQPQPELGGSTSKHVLSAGALAWRKEQCRAVHLELLGS